MYFEEDEDDGSDGEDESVADEGLAGEAADGPGLADLDDDEGEPEGLDCAGQREDEGELTIAEEQVGHEDDASEHSPRDRVCFLYIFHTCLQYYMPSVSLIQSSLPHT